MTPSDFVDALKRRCRDGAVEDCVQKFAAPPGRRPREELVRLSKWFNSLSVSDRDFVVRAMREAADATLFGVLCVIDGVRPIEPLGDKSDFTLSANRAGTESKLSPSETFLHDLLRSEP